MPTKNFRDYRIKYGDNHDEDGGWKTVCRPGYAGRRRDQRAVENNAKYGVGNWRIVWAVKGDVYSFVMACVHFYEESYYQYLKDRPEDLDFITSFAECIDNAPSNINSGLNYNHQEAFSCHIQDIAIRNVLKRLGLQFRAKRDAVLVIRSNDSNGYRFGPGNIPFFDRSLIVRPAIRPGWANPDSVEEFHQSNKILQRRLQRREIDVRTPAR